MRTKTVTVDGVEYNLKSLNRGQVRTIGAIDDNHEQTDELVRLSVVGVDIDDIDMQAFVKLTEEIVRFNGLGETSINDAKKN